MRLPGRLLLYLFLGLGTARGVLYLAYVAAILPIPVEAYHLEAKMVLLAWRAQRGISLYPEWRDYPHVANIFGPVYFLVVGLLGRRLGVDVPGLFLVGRAVTFVASLLTSLIVVVWVARRYSRGAGLAAGLLSLGSGPMYGFSIMVRSDAMADLLGVAGFFLGVSSTRTRRIAGVVLLILSALTKQTAGVFLLATALAAAMEGRWPRALGVLGGGLAGLLLVVVVVNALIEPHFARSLFGASSMPWSLGHWWQILDKVIVMTPDILYLPVIGLCLWLGDRPRELRLTALTLVLLASSLSLSAMVGSDLNYYLSLRVVEAMAVGALWHALHAPGGCSLARSAALTLATALAVVSVVPCLLNGTGQVVQVRRLVDFLEGPDGRRVLLEYRTAIALARNPDVHLLTDSGLIDLYQGERAAFGDPWLFRKLVDLGRLRPETIRRRIESEDYDWIVTMHDLGAPDYPANDFRLPLVLVEPARAHYILKDVKPGLYFYGRRGVRRSPEGGLAR